MDVGWIVQIRPALYAREKSLDTGAVPAHAVGFDCVFVNDQIPGRIPHPESNSIAPVARMGGDPSSIRILAVYRDQVFGAGKEKYIGLPIVEILRQSLFGLAGDGWER